MFPLKASCELQSRGGSCSGADISTGVSGLVEFEQMSDEAPATIAYNVTGLEPGLHGFHMYIYNIFTHYLYHTL